MFLFIISEVPISTNVVSVLYQTSHNVCVLKRSYYSALVAPSKSPLKIIKFTHYMCLVILTVEICLFDTI